MKKLSILTSSVLVLFASNVYANGISNKVEVSTSVGQTQVNSIDYKDVNYGVGVKDTFKFNDEHGVYVGLSGKKSAKDDYVMNGIKMPNAKSKTYDVNMGYKYEKPINYHLTVSPFVGVGYESTQVKMQNEKNNLNRGYAEIGVDSEYRINKDWSLNPAFKYKRDLNVKEQMNHVYMQDPKRGYQYDVELGVGHKLGNSELVVAPYHSRYKNKNIETQKKVQDTGVRVKYDF